MISIKKPIYIVLALSAIFTVIIQLDLTRSIIFDNYLETRAINGVDYYLSLINESSKGNWTLGSPYLLEWRYKPYLYPALNINAAGLVKRIFGLDIKTYSLLMGYAAVFVLVVLLIIAFLTLFNFRYFGYLAATFYIFSPRLIEWQRTLSPEINFIPFALFLIFYFSRLAFWKREVGLGILAGLLFYVYPYYWTFTLALLVASDILFFWQQRKIVWRYLYKYLIITGIASWYGFHLWQLYQLPYYQESMVRIGALYSRFPAGLYTQIILLASLIAFFFFKKYFPRNFDKVAVGLAAGLIVLNQQLITGMQLDFNSHYLPAIIIFLVAFWSRLIFGLANHFSSYKKILVTLSVLAAIGVMSNRIYYLAANPSSQDIYVAGRADSVVDWFLKNQIRDKVVYAPEDLGDDINLWTNNYLYFHFGQELQLIPTAELIDRFTYANITDRDITDHLFDRQTPIFGQTFISSWQKDMVLNKIKAFFSGKRFVATPLDQYVTYDFALIYKKRINPDVGEFIRHLDKYQVDYLVYRQKDRESIYKLVPGKIVFEDKDFIIKEKN